MFDKLKTSLKFISAWKKGDLTIEYEWNPYSKKHLTAIVTLKDKIEIKLWVGSGPWFLYEYYSFRDEEPANCFGYLGRHLVYWIVIHKELKRLDELKRKGISKDANFFLDDIHKRLYEGLK